MDTGPILVWLRQDLRLADHPALDSALHAGTEAIPVYVLDEDSPWPLGGASRWWLHESLARLGAAMAAIGGRLILRKGATAEELARLAADTGARAVFWNRRYEAHERALEDRVTNALRAGGVETRSFPGNLLFEPGSLPTKGGGEIRVFAAFWRSALSLPPPAFPLPAPERLPGPTRMAARPALDDLGLVPCGGRTAAELADTWTPGEEAARSRLDGFLADGLEVYAARRNHPALGGTSRLSPHLAFGELSPRQIWHAVAARSPSHGAESFLREIGWREFSYFLLAAHPDLPSVPIRTEFAAFPWQSDETQFAAWREGRTGFPIVDAGMRQLWRTGWMHNRVRMIVASFLIKDMLMPWQAGEAWFRDRLVDADLAVNATSWQWVAGCGTDAAPYFRVFNPVLQGEKYDPLGQYVRRWIPELAPMSDLGIHRPWEAAPAALAAAGIRLGQNYPLPILDHVSARRRALAAYNRVRGTG
ncbi:MAG: deoxyribodipyrimidine photo-lyase [Magnetospirillum sp.]|nr:deoxyribodipyrimidine photo-lyase [Magnetospirillum sp.]